VQNDDQLKYIQNIDLKPKGLGNEFLVELKEDILREKIMSSGEYK
jgi:hypothetical protein